jgi:uncharacterized membrane protein YhaH (DUF805 family)
MRKFIGYVGLAFRRYTDFEGISSRSEFWYFALFGAIINLICYLTNSIDKYSILDIVTSLILFLPNIAVSIRRMHDTDHSGWFILVPVYGYYLNFKKSVPNRWSAA